MCSHPLHINGIDFSVPCGCCEECLRRKTSDWALRIESLSKKHVSFFFTLTYTEKDVPRNCFGDRVVCRKDISDFLKRFRQNLVRHIDKDFKIKYFICSEYGPKNTNRPHYHGLIFVDRSYYYDLVIKQFKSTPSKFDKLFAKELFDSWGHCVRAAFDFASLSDSVSCSKVTQYVAKYFTYGKFLPEWMYKKASSLFLDHYKRIHRDTYGFALINQHNIDSYLRVCSCKDEDRRFQVAKRLWIKTFFPPCFLAASNGIGIDLLSHGQISVWENVIDTIIRYSRLSLRDRVRFFDLSELRNMFHSLFILHSANGHVRSCPRYIRNKFKQYELITTGCPDLLQDCVKLAKDLGIMTFDKYTDTVFYSPPEFEDVYRRNDYISYKNQHNVSL